MLSSLSLAVCAFMMLFVMPATAAGDSGRYDFVPVREGALRLDRETGAVTLCAGPVGARSCAPVGFANAPVSAHPGRSVPDITASARPDALNRLSRLAGRAMERLIADVASVRRGWRE